MKEGQLSHPLQGISKDAVIYLVGLVCVSFTYTWFLIDEALIGRFVVLVFFLITLLVVAGGRVVGAMTIGPGLFLYAGYWLFSTLTALWALNPSESFFESGKIFFGFLIFLFTALILEKDGSFFRSLARVILLIFIGYVIVIAAESVIAFDSDAKFDVYAVTGINGHKNELSGFLFLLMPFLILCARDADGILKYVARICILLNALILVMLKTQAVWLGVVVAAMAAIAQIFLTQRRRIRLIMGGGLLLAAVVISISFPGIANRFRELEHSSFEVRRVLWINTTEMIRDHPLGGVGLGNWRLIFPNYGLGRFTNKIADGDKIQSGLLVPDRPHNDFLWIMSETGLVGFLLYFLVFVVLGYQLLKFLKKETISFHVITLSSFVAGYLVISQFSFPRERVEEIFMINAILGCLFFLVRDQSKRIESPAGTKVLPIIAGLLAAIFLIIGIERAHGEYFARRILEARQAGDSVGAVQFASEAESWYYQIDNFGIPIFWYAGVGKVETGDFASALVFFKKAFLANPYNVQVLNNLGSAHEVLGNHAEAKKYYREALRISPRFDEARLNLAAIYYNEGDYNEAFSLTLLVGADGDRNNTDRKRQYLKLIHEKINTQP